MTSRLLICAALVVGYARPGLTQSVPAPPQPLTIEGAVTHVYKSIKGVELRLHIFTPPGAASSQARPAIIFFSGGGWTTGNIGQFVPQSQHLAQRGMVAI